MAGPSFAAHAENLVRALSSRPTLTDDVAAMERQVAAYAARYADADLALGLIDSAYVARDLRSRRCRDFNEALGCAWFDEIACYSDRDQLSFPRPAPRLCRLAAGHTRIAFAGSPSGSSASRRRRPPEGPARTPSSSRAARTPPSRMRSTRC